MAWDTTVTRPCSTVYHATTSPNVHVTRVTSGPEAHVVCGAQVVTLVTVGTLKTGLHVN